MLKILVLILLGANVSLAHNYAIPSILENVFSGRKEKNPIQVELRHQIEGSSRVLKETISYGDNQVLIEWSEEGDASNKTWAVVNKKGYDFLGAGVIARQSKLFLQYLLLREPTYFQASLIREGFVRRDQLREYKPGYEFSGSPKTWSPKDYYLKHPGISIQRLEQGGTALAVVGTDEGLDKRITYFDRSNQGIRALEWKEEGRSTVWNFDVFKKVPAGGYYPKRVTLTKAGVDMIRSELVTVRLVDKKKWQQIQSEFRAKRGNNSIPSSIRSSLSNLIRYR